MLDILKTHFFFSPFFRLRTMCQGFFLLSLTVFFSGCGIYDRDFNCPLTEKGRCQSLQKTYSDLKFSMQNSDSFRLEETSMLEERV